MAHDDIARSDLLLARRLRDGRLPPVALTVDMIVRLAWIHVRLWDDREAQRRLADGIERSGATLLAGLVPGLVSVVRAADAADHTPARSSVEFAWRHPELCALPIR